jgi:hypothetical protein
LGGLACLATTILTPGRGSADGGQTLRGESFAPFSGEIAVILKQTMPKEQWLTLARVNVKPSVDNAWAKARGPLINQLKQELGKPRRWDGQTAYQIDLNLAQLGELQGRAFGSVGLRYVLRGNSVAFTMTTPTVFGKSADPRFVIDFDLILTVEMQVSLDAPVKVTSATVEVNASEPRGGNLVGDLVKAVAQIGHFFGGPDLVGQVRSRINAIHVNVANQIGGLLADMAPSLSKLNLPNLTLRPYFDVQGQRFYFALTQEKQGMIR